MSFSVVRYIALYTVFGACTYDMVIHKSDICIKLQLSVLMIAGSYYVFLLNAGLVCGGHHEIFSHASL